MRILVVEDVRDLNRLIVKTLTKAGYNVDGYVLLRQPQHIIFHLPKKIRKFYVDFMFPV